MSKIGMVDVIQLGAREHYALASMLYMADLLRYLHTDLYLSETDTSFNLLKSANRSLHSSLVSKALGRTSAIPQTHVKRHQWFGIKNYLTSMRSRTPGEAATYYSRQADQFARVISKDITPPAPVTIGYRSILPVFQQLGDRSKKILSQIDGGWHEVEIMNKELANNLDWVENTQPVFEEFGWLETERQRLNKEWAVSDIIVCNSSWTQQCMIESGVDRNNTTIIPLAYDAPVTKPRTTSPSHSLTVGFLGTLTLRKGIHILCEAARYLGNNVHVMCAGTLQVKREKLAEYPNVEYLGTLPRTELEPFFEEIDVLVLPSISEGFGIVQLEAIARGIPVIATNHTGDVVIPNESGIEVNAGSVEELTNALHRCLMEKSLLPYMSKQALERSKTFRHENIRRMWESLIESVLEK